MNRGNTVFCAQELREAPHLLLSRFKYVEKATSYKHDPGVVGLEVPSAGHKISMPEDDNCNNFQLSPL